MHMCLDISMVFVLLWDRCEGKPAAAGFHLQQHSPQQQGLTSSSSFWEGWISFILLVLFSVVFFLLSFFFFKQLLSKLQLFSRKTKAYQSSVTGDYIPTACTPENSDGEILMIWHPSFFVFFTLLISFSFNLMDRNEIIMICLWHGFAEMKWHRIAFKWTRKAGLDVFFIVLPTGKAEPTSQVWSLPRVEMNLNKTMIDWERKGGRGRSGRRQGEWWSVLTRRGTNKRQISRVSVSLTRSVVYVHIRSLPSSHFVPLLLFLQAPPPLNSRAKESKAAFNCRVQKVWSWTNEPSNQSQDFFLPYSSSGWGEGGRRLRHKSLRFRVEGIKEGTFVNVGRADCVCESVQPQARDRVRGGGERTRRAGYGRGGEETGNAQPVKEREREREPRSLQ